MPEQAPDGSIIITPKEFYDGVRQDIGEIKDSVSALRSELAPIPNRVDRLETRLDAVETKVSGLDKKIVWFAGFAAGAGGTVGTVLSRYLGQ